MGSSEGRQRAQVSGAMAAGSLPRRRFDQAASASRLAALMRITVETIAFSNLK